ncbi:DUF6232 family protein [Streptomyces sp. NPDC059104]|uniref:DUF6232 family protein n=1 Tax=Streptomyces sp. NPDC059104 TaxID=3346729 RepID=UPI00367FA585
METNGPPPPEQPPPLPPPPSARARPGAPPVPQGPPGQPPAGHAGLPSSLDLTVTKRLLWVGGAVYPLQNVARVYTFVLKPRRKESVVTFARRTALTLLAALGFTVFGKIAGFLARSADSTFDGTIQFVWIASGIGLLYYFADMMAVLTASSHFVLAVESNGQSTALVTGRPDHLNGLVHQIAYAIENPDTELRVRVERLTISNPSNYYFGDTVNMYGGQGNSGVTHG